MKLSTIHRLIKEANDAPSPAGDFDEFMSSIEQLEKHAKERRVMEPNYSKQDLLSDIHRELPDIDQEMANKMVEFVFKHIDADVTEASIDVDVQTAPTAEELDVGEPVKIIGNVNYHGKVGHIDSFGSDKKFVIVDLGNAGLHSFHSSDVSYYTEDGNTEIEDDDIEESISEGYGRYYCSTDKKWKTRKGPKQTRKTESVITDPALTLDEQFDIIEEMVEQIAEKYGVDAELIWEDFEAVDDRTLLETAAWQKKSGKNKNGGLNKKGVASYRKSHPGSKLQTAVTTKPSKLKKGSKAAKRRKSFCARMGGMKGPMKDKNGKPTRKALALKKWNCRESIEDMSTTYITSEAEGDKNGVPHVTNELLKHIIQQVGTEGANAIIKSLKWGDGAAKELLKLITQDLKKNISMAESVKQRIDPKCWKGYKKQGTKMKGGVRVNNCVPESTEQGVAEDAEGEKPTTWYKDNKPFSLQRNGSAFYLIDQTGRVVKNMQIPPRYIPMNLEDEGYKMSKTGREYYKNPGWFKEAAGDNPEDVITVDVPLFIRLMEYAREDAKTDMDLHVVTEKLTAMSAEGRTLSMADYDAIISSNTVKEEQVNEVNPHNYDSDIDYYDALRARKPQREEPDDEIDYGDNDRLKFKTVAKPTQHLDNEEGTAPNGQKYNNTVTFSGGATAYANKAAADSYKDYHWGAKKAVDARQDGDNYVLYVVDNHKHGMWKPWKDAAPIDKAIDFSSKNNESISEGAVLNEYAAFKKGSK